MIGGLCRRESWRWSEVINDYDEPWHGNDDHFMTKRGELIVDLEMIHFLRALRALMTSQSGFNSFQGQKILLWSRFKIKGLRFEMTLASSILLKILDIIIMMIRGITLIMMTISLIRVIFNVICSKEGGEIISRSSLRSESHVFTKSNDYNHWNHDNDNHL